MEKGVTASSWGLAGLGASGGGALGSGRPVPCPVVEGQLLECKVELPAPRGKGQQREVF
jgi:hypothetical protein